MSISNLEILSKCLAVIAIIAAGVWSLFLFFKSQQIQKAQLYKDLELKAIDLFLEAMKNSELNKIYDSQFEIPKTDIDSSESMQWSDSIASMANYAYSILNLFELVFNLQKRRLITEEIFMTWVAWYWDFSRGVFTQWLWRNAKWNYSTEFMEVMDKFFQIKDDSWADAYTILDNKGVLRYDLKKWLEARGGRS
ncbi:MAG: hypothetical protein PHY72_01970 [Candidatus Pacebacteria bacterium]|nr:hypothetical protein [Candidatus Paceibacterota bacterium]